MSKKNIIIITVMTIITIITVIIFTPKTSAARYRPPPPPPPPADEPIPPPEEKDNPPENDGPPPTAVPTPTPCIPNWCFIQQTSCCFDPICVFLSSTTHGDINRCPRPKPEEGKYLGLTKVALPTFIKTFASTLSVIFLGK